jgi:hypothetical protein
LHAHRIQRREFFLTRDKAILKIADELAGVGIVIIMPSDYLRPIDGSSPRSCLDAALRDAHGASWRDVETGIPTD